MTISFHLSYQLLQGQDTLQKLNDSLNELANRKKISTWVYNPEEDDGVKSLYPMAFEVQTATSDSPRKKPIRHSSFSGPRYAKISQKPKRAHSFAQQSDFKRERISITHLDLAPLPELPRPKIIIPPRSHYAKPNKPIFRSNSMQITKLEKENSHGPKLSSKYQSCSYGEFDSLSILEVGSLNSSKNSERSLVDALTDIPSRSINSILSSSFEKETNDVLEYKLKINKNNYTYSFASPALTAIENIDRTSQTYSSSSTRRVYSETHYATPNNVRRDIDDDNNFETSYKRKYHTNKISSLPTVHKLIPRINLEKPMFADRKFESVSDSDQSSNEDINSEDKRLSERYIEDSVDQSYSQPYSSTSWRKDGKVTYFESNALPVIEEIERCSTDDNESENQNEYEVIREDEKSIVEKKKTFSQDSVEQKTKVASKPPIAKPPRYSVLKKNMLQNQERTLNSQNSNKSKAEIKLSVYDATQLRNSNDVRSRAGSEDKEIYHISFSSYELTEDSSSHYDTESANTLDESQESIETSDKVSSPEIKRNKIVLRVPSFKSTSCQTEKYKPIRRRASSFVPSNQNTGGNTREGLHLSNRSFKSISNWNRSTNSLETSSSSGYSSPEITSKNSSSNQSSPPSPGDKEYSTSKSSGSKNKSNVTIIEINRSDNTTLISTLPYPPPIPPKPKRYRHSTAGDLRNEMNFISSYDRMEEKNNSISSSKYDSYTLRDTELPLGVHQKKKFDIPYRSQSLKTTRQNTPRIVDIKLKNGVMSPKESNSTTDFFAEEGRMSVLPRFEISGVVEQSLDKVDADGIINLREDVQGRLDEVLDINIGLQWRREREKELTEKWASDKDGSATAAYLASLELLASHYRHQALTNAKKLQRQMEFLEDQNILPKKKMSDVPTTYHGKKKRLGKGIEEEEEGDSITNWRTTIDDLRKVQVDKNGVWHT